jgi:hypothetical protein
MSEPNESAPRRRFVIPFGPGPKPGSTPPFGAGPGRTASGKRSRGRGCLKFFLVVLVLFLIVLVGGGIGGYFYWQKYQREPGYSLALMFNAALNSDQKTFEEMVDTDRVSDDLSDQVTTKALAAYPGEMTEAVRAQIQKAVKDFLPTVKERARAELPGEVAKKGEKLKGYPFVVMAVMVPRVIKIEESGDTAKAIAPPDAGGTELTLQRSGDRWKVVAVKDDAAVNRILASVAGDLPTPDILKGKKLPKLPRNMPKIPGLN